MRGNNWRMHLQMGQSGLTRLSDPCAVFEMTSSDADVSNQKVGCLLVWVWWLQPHVLTLHLSVGPEREKVYG
jgi:hypothetical protein